MHLAEQLKWRIKRNDYKNSCFDLNYVVLLFVHVLSGQWIHTIIHTWWFGQRNVGHAIWSSLLLRISGPILNTSWHVFILHIKLKVLLGFRSWVWRIEMGKYINHRVDQPETEAKLNGWILYFEGMLGSLKQYIAMSATVSFLNALRSFTIICKKTYIISKMEQCGGVGRVRIPYIIYQD